MEFVKEASVLGIKFEIYFFDQPQEHYLHADDLDYGFAYDGAPVSDADFEDLKLLFQDESEKITLELSEDGRTIFASIGELKLELYDNVYQRGISIRQVIDTLEMNSLEDVKTAYKQIVNEYNDLRNDHKLH